MSDEAIDAALTKMKTTRVCLYEGHEILERTSSGIGCTPCMAFMQHMHDEGQTPDSYWQKSALLRSVRSANVIIVITGTARARERMIIMIIRK